MSSSIQVSDVLDLEFTRSLQLFIFSRSCAHSDFSEHLSRSFSWGSLTTDNNMISIFKKAHPHPFTLSIILSQSSLSAYIGAKYFSTDTESCEFRWWQRNWGKACNQWKVLYCANKFLNFHQLFLLALRPHKSYRVLSIANLLVYFGMLRHTHASYDIQFPWLQWILLSETSNRRKFWKVFATRFHTQDV